MAIAQHHLCALESIAGEKAVIPASVSQAHLTEWRKKWPGQSPLLLAPGTTEEVSAIVRYCHEHSIGITPQGGNTGLVGGQMPQGQILITLKRMRKVRDVSPLNNAMTLEAGVTLAEAQNTAKEVDRLFPLSIGSEGTCQIGGVVSTNAGGVNVIRYGNMRDLVLGIEAVLPNGEIWNGLTALRKDNTGYDVKHLLVGGEGTLGIVTAATLKIYPRPRETVTAFAALKSPQCAVDLLNFMQGQTGGLASSFELMSQPLMTLVSQHFDGLKSPLETITPWYVLMEFSTGQEGQLRSGIESALAEAHGKNMILDATIAENEMQAERLWALRHHAAPAMAQDPASAVKCDISVPIHYIPNFLQSADEVVAAQQPASRVIAFGHMGDGNIHYDVLGPSDAAQSDFEAARPKMQLEIHDIVASLDGSISAEHGIGIFKRDELKIRKSETELAMMRAIKNALDPKGIMNPGKLL
ncbi:FAD-binding oxidoreductase [Parvularcula sp. IMCC14364]|uniref:FAD-binding oxidoreductase n=1 Tax=Parvularcula sp. IMCC14364 TaxID=3067902 RepID=UPI00274183CB|nr:FAD-binding oxidoreductase [Parvularcula sp. IMCC14364]